MADKNDNLETECEDAVFQICCTRERYSVRCANQLEKYLSLITKRQTTNIQKASTTKYEVSPFTEEQQKLIKQFETCPKFKTQKSSKQSVKELSSRIKELKSILKQIEKSSKTEIHQRLEK